MILGWKSIFDFDDLAFFLEILINLIANMLIQESMFLLIEFSLTDRGLEPVYYSSYGVRVRL